MIEIVDIHDLKADSIYLFYDPLTGVEKFLSIGRFLRIEENCPVYSDIIPWLRGGSNKLVTSHKPQINCDAEDNIIFKLTDDEILTTIVLSSI